MFITHLVVTEKPFTYQYEKTNSGIEITGYKKRVLNNYGDFYIEIPSHINGEKVTKINNAIKNENLKNIFIPKSVLYIEEKAFVGCNNLTISTEHLEKPLTWNENWNFENKEVKWNLDSK